MSEETQAPSRSGFVPPPTDPALPPHEEPKQAPQPLQGLVEQVRQARMDVGALISRTDQIEAQMRRIDRQTIMLVGTLAVVLWSVKRALVKIEELDLGA